MLSRIVNHLMRRCTVQLLSSAVLAFAVSAAQAQLVVEISRGIERPEPIAIVPFGWSGPGDVPYDLATVITADLRNSGRFAPLPLSDMLSQPTRPNEVRFDDWRILDVGVLLIGELREEAPNRYRASFQLLDVLSGEQMLGFRLTAAGDDLRAMAHRIADMAYERLIGDRGIFGTQIAYVTETRNGDPSQRYKLIVADYDGENAQIVTASAHPLMSPAWSPDGRRMAYVSFEELHAVVYVQTLRTGTRERVSGRAGVNNAPVFSPDGRYLALTLSLDEGNLDIYTLELATQVLRRITRNAAIDTEPVWSPNGEMLYFTSDRSGRPQVYRVDAEPGGRPERVTFEGVYNARPRVSPDGHSLAVVHQNRGLDQVAIVDIATSVTQVLSDGELDESPSFAPNGKVVIYATQERGQGVLASVSTDGRIKQRIASVEGDVREPVWSPYRRP